MSESFKVRSFWREYAVRFEDDFTARLAATLRKGDVIVVDENVRRLHAQRLEPFLAGYSHLVVEATEEQKTYVALGLVIGALIERGFRKDNRLIAIGGGIIQDITGFAASILYRGVDWIFYPTTLLAQCDSCIGSKTSINFGRFKNQVGTFYPPVEVVIDLNFLDTLTEQAVLSGFGEMIHYYLVSSEADFHRIKADYVLSLTDKPTLKSLIARSLEIKRGFIERDELDHAERQVLNYGHSFGHTIETLTDYGIPHGIAVSYGMDIANYLSARLGYLSEELRLDIRELLAWNWGLTELKGIKLRDFEAVLSKDKKNVGSEIRVILTRGPGRMFKTPLLLNNMVSGWLRTYLESAGPGNRPHRHD